MFAARLSKAGTESEMTEIFTGDILRFGSDVVDKSRNVTQKCVIMRVALQHPGGEDQVRRDSRSRLYSTVLYCTVLNCTVLYCTVLYCTVLYCTC